MTVRRRTAASDADDLAEVSFLNDAERAESEWLLARQSDPGAPAPSAKIASDHAELEDLLGSLPSGPADESWHDEVLRTVASSPPSRPWRRRKVAGWTAAGGLMAVAAVVVLMLLPRAELEVAIRHGDQKRSDIAEVVVGDQLVVSARPREASELRVYRSDGTLVARCPDGPRCRVPAHGEYTIEVTLDAPVSYHVILVAGMTGAPPVGTMDAYLDAARAANARVVVYPPIDVH